MSSDHHDSEVYRDKKKPKNPIKFNITLNEEQKKAKDIVLNSTISVLKGKAGSGKANWINTKVLTPDGYKLMKDINIGDEVISEEGKPIKVIDVFPQGKKPIYKIIFSDNSSTECTLDHLWMVIRRTNLHSKINRNGNKNTNYGKYEILSTEEIIKQGLGYSRLKWSIPLTKPIHFNKKQLEIDPYILGCLLGDGSFTQKTINITNEDEEIIKYFKDYFNKFGLEVNKASDNSISYYISQKTKKIKIDGFLFNSTKEAADSLNISLSALHYRIKKDIHKIEYLDNFLLSSLKKYNLLGTNSFNKFIPLDYLHSSIEDRINLLQGLLDTDGWCQVSKSKNKKGVSSNAYFCTTSEQLKDDIIYLVNSLGGLCKSHIKTGKYRNKGENKYKETSINYRICISFNNHEIESNLFKLKRKQDKVILSKNKSIRSIKSIEYLFEDEAKCILVDSPNHLYLVDNSIVTHNSLLAAQTALDLLFRKDIEKIIITRPTVIAGADIGFLPGDINQKLAPLTAPVYDNMHRIYDKEKIEKLVTEGLIEVIPVAFMRGRNFTDCLVIIDEAQNLTDSQMELILTRLCIGSKIIICGDSSQIDLKDKKTSGFSFICNNMKEIEGFNVITLETNHRHPIVEEILKKYNEIRS